MTKNMTKTVVEVDSKQVEVLFVQRERRGHSRVYVFPEKGAETVFENLVNRHSRPVADWRKLAEGAMRELGMNTDEAYLKLRWSQKAGCSCGCSPGFVMADTDLRVYALADGSTKVMPYSQFGWDMFVTPVDPNAVVEVPSNVILSEN